MTPLKKCHTTIHNLIGITYAIDTAEPSLQLTPLPLKLDIVPPVSKTGQMYKEGHIS